MVNRRRLVGQDGRTVEPPEPVTRLDALLEIARIAHEAIFDLHRKLTSIGRATPESRALLAESAQLAVRQIPKLTSNARALTARWRDESVLNLAAAERTLGELTAELERIEPDLESALNRQRQVAAGLRSMLEP